MKFRAFSRLVVACVVACQHVQKSEAQRLTEEDEAFCNGELELSYPGVDIGSCMILPQKVRAKISQEWGAPQVRLASANKQKKYTLMMVDPDAPSRTNPTRAYWRHWLLVDIEGSTLVAGKIKGTILSDYTCPTPPQHTGFHRYQFLVYEQPTGQALSLTEEELSSLGKWDPQAFVKKFGLISPVASLQFLTQNYKD
ncbi:phosphatidylethanolamine-binding protein 4 [Trichomycterus rosablanca]|uniref:phosphatidylethanolamine-binding protein 4 n=1 Tax=Trichomycterus rosablanca TaxID=2290929 RepID=UPI002F355C5B